MLRITLKVVFSCKGIDFLQNCKRFATFFIKNFIICHFFCPCRPLPADAESAAAAMMAGAALFGWDDLVARMADRAYGLGVSGEPGEEGLPPLLSFSLTTS